jgi:hypothetical protein
VKLRSKLGFLNLGRSRAEEDTTVSAYKISGVVGSFGGGTELRCLVDLISESLPADFRDHSDELLQTFINPGRPSKHFG